MNAATPLKMDTSFIDHFLVIMNLLNGIEEHLEKAFGITLLISAIGNNDTGDAIVSVMQSASGKMDCFPVPTVILMGGNGTAQSTIALSIGMADQFSKMFLTAIRNYEIETGTVIPRPELIKSGLPDHSLIFHFHFPVHS